ncbi:MAG: hypothetical protein IKQ04_00370, partial [Oscillospiraceae bacterium]|nr:hypothetical protein [Oscillospiraceae bacterium]
LCVRYSHTVRFAVTAVLFGAEYGKREQDLAALTRPCSFSWLFIYSPSQCLFFKAYMHSKNIPSNGRVPYGVIASKGIL